MIASSDYLFRGKGLHAYWRPYYKYLQSILRDFNQKLYLPAQTSTDTGNIDYKSFLRTLILVLLFNLIPSVIDSFLLFHSTVL